MVQAPSAVLIRWKSSRSGTKLHDCSGTLLTENVILTARQCCYEFVPISSTEGKYFKLVEGTVYAGGLTTNRDSEDVDSYRWYLQDCELDQSLRVDTETIRTPENVTSNKPPSRVCHMDF